MTRSRFRARAQQGVVLLFGLVVLVALVLGAVAISRSVDTTTLIAGGYTFKQEGVAASSVGSEMAIEWLQKNLAGAFLESDHEDQGYYASSLDGLDVTGNRTTSSSPLRIVKWDDRCDSATGAYSTCNTIPAAAITVNGNKVQWIITRLCAGPGPAGGANSCAMPAQAASSYVSDRNHLNQGSRFKSGSTTPYFRIVVRVEGVRHTVSVTEQLVHF